MALATFFLREEALALALPVGAFFDEEGFFVAFGDLTAFFADFEDGFLPGGAFLPLLTSLTPVRLQN
jgi:hypothetical protein